MTHLKNNCEKQILSNGLTVLFTPAPQTQLCSIQYFVKTGSIHESEFPASGISHYLEHLVFKGTKDYTADEITKSCQEIGGSQNAYTSFDRTVYYIDCPSNNFSKGLNILTDMVFRPTFPKDEIDKERSVILREIDMNEDDPDRVLGQALFSLSYRNHSLQYPIIGKTEAFKKITESDLKNYYERRYTPENMILSVCGDIQSEAFWNQVTKELSDISYRPTYPAYIPEEPPQICSRKQEIPKKLNLVKTAISYSIPNLYSKSIPALDVLAHVLGQGQSSLLWQELREKEELVYSIDAHAWAPTEGTGLFYISFACDENKQEEAINNIELVFQKLAKIGDLQERIDAAYKNVSLSEIRSLKTVSGTASKIGNSEFCYGSTDYTETYLEKLKTLKAKDLLQAANDFLLSKPRNMVSIGKTIAGSSKSVRTFADSTRLEGQTFPNGNHILFIDDKKLPLTQFSLVTRGGLCLEPQGKNGISSIFAQLLTKDTFHKDALSIAKLTERNGIHWSSFSGKNSMGVTAECSIDDCKTVVRLFQDAISDIQFLPERFNREKEAQIASIKEQNDDIFQLGKQELGKAFFGSHYLANNPYGNIEDLQNLKLEDLAEFRSHNFLTKPWVLAIGGNIPDEETIQPLLSLMELADTTKHAELPTYNREVNTTFKTVPFDSQQAVLFQGFVCPGICDDDYHFSELLEDYLGSSAGRLFYEIREKRGLAYYAGASRLLGLDEGMMFFYAGTEPKNQSEIFEIFESELQLIHDGKIDEDAIARSKVALIASKRKSVQSTSSKTTQAALNTLYGLPSDDWTDYGEKIEAITTRQLQEFSRKWRFGQITTRLAIGPSELSS